MAPWQSWQRAAPTLPAPALCPWTPEANCAVLSGWQVPHWVGVAEAWGKSPTSLWQPEHLRAAWTLLSKSGGKMVKPGRPGLRPGVAWQSRHSCATAAPHPARNIPPISKVKLRLNRPPNDFSTKRLFPILQQGWLGHRDIGSDSESCRAFPVICRDKRQPGSPHPGEMHAAFQRLENAADSKIGPQSA